VNPTVYCTNHGQQFRKVDEEQDTDGTQILVKQYWAASCNCNIEITLAVPLPERN
jgi:hypothetical protein